MESPCRVFIVDDNELTRSMLRACVNGEDYTVVGEATNLQGMMERCREAKPDVLFLDVQLPDGDGLVALPALKERLPNAAILIVTASSDVNTVRTAIGNGAHGFIIKPFNPGTVRDAVSSARRRMGQLAQPATGH